LLMTPHSPAMFRIISIATSAAVLEAHTRMHGVMYQRRIM